MAGFNIGFGIGTGRKGASNIVPTPPTTNVLASYAWVAGTNTTTPVPIVSGWARALRNGTDNPRIWKRPTTLVVGQIYDLLYSVQIGTASSGGVIFRISTSSDLPNGNKYQLTHASNTSNVSVRLPMFLDNYYMGIVPLTGANGQYAEVNDAMSLIKRPDLGDIVPWVAGTNTTITQNVAGAANTGEFVRITAVGVNNPRASKAISGLTIGATYNLCYIAKQGTSSSPPIVRVYNDVNLATSGPSSFTMSTANEEIGTHTFVATATTHYAGMVGIVNANGQYCEVSQKMSVTYVSGP